MLFKLCIMLNVRDQTYYIKPEDQISQILIHNFSTMSFKKWMTEMATPSAFTFFESFSLTSLLILNQKL